MSDYRQDPTRVIRHKQVLAALDEALAATDQTPVDQLILYRARAKQVDPGEMQEFSVVAATKKHDAVAHLDRLILDQEAREQEQQRQKEAAALEQQATVEAALLDDFSIHDAVPGSSDLDPAPDTAGARALIQEVLDLTHAYMRQPEPIAVAKPDLLSWREKLYSALYKL